MAVDDLIARFSQLPHAVVGRGPRHPVQSDDSIEPAVRQFLDQYPELRRDAGYVDFLEKYSGAAIEYPDETVIVNLLGFSDASIDMLELDGPVVKDGLLVFALCVYNSFPEDRVEMYEHDFAFAVGDDLKRGIYRYYSTSPDSGKSLSWYTSDFLTWLAEFVDKRGVYERLDVERES